MIEKQAFSNFLACLNDSTNTCVRTSGLARGDGEYWTCRHLGSVQMTSTLNLPSFTLHWLNIQIFTSCMDEFCFSHTCCSRGHTMCCLTHESVRSLKSARLFSEHQSQQHTRVICTIGVFRYKSSRFGEVVQFCFSVPATKPQKDDLTLKLQLKTSISL